MRRLFFILLALLALGVGQASAQRYLPGMRGIELCGGFVEGVKQPLNYYFGVGLSTYTKKGNRWVFGAEFLQKHYAYGDLSIPKAQFTAEGGYYFKFLSDPSKTLFLSVGGSALLGYETSNWGEKLLPDGATLMNQDAFIYGGAVGLELEAYLADRIVFLVHVRQRVLFGSTIGKFHTQFGVGVKFIIN